jgi:hypothetical protein
LLPGNHCAAFLEIGVFDEFNGCGDGSHMYKWQDILSPFYVKSSKGVMTIEIQPELFRKKRCNKNQADEPGKKQEIFFLKQKTGNQEIQQRINYQQMAGNKFGVTDICFLNRTITNAKTPGKIIQDKDPEKNMPQPPVTQ